MQYLKNIKAKEIGLRINFINDLNSYLEIEKYYQNVVMLNFYMLDF